jgi:hypothetical protein
MQRHAGSSRGVPDESRVERGVAGRVLLVALGAVGALLGLALAAVGVVLLVLTGRDTTFGGGEATLSTDRYALVTEAAGLGRGGLHATVRVRVRANHGGAVFVGVAPAADVDGYLAGSAYDELVDVRLSPLRATLRPSAGTRAPTRPAEGPRWTVSASGTGEQTVDVPVGDGGQRLVVMNADAAAGVDVTAALSVRAPFLRRLALGLLAAGAVVAPTGGLLLVAGVRRVLRSRPLPVEPG